MSVTAVVVAAVGGGAAGAVASQALANRHGRLASLRAEKIKALNTVLEANEAARAALTDFRHALDRWEEFVKTKRDLSRDKIAAHPETSELRERADEASERAHGAMRTSRRTSIAMALMFPPRLGLLEVAHETRSAFRHLRGTLLKVQAALDAPDPKVDLSLREDLEAAREKRRQAEDHLVEVVHPALWAWWSRRGRSSPPE